MKLGRKRDTGERVRLLLKGREKCDGERNREVKRGGTGAIPRLVKILLITSWPRKIMSLPVLRAEGHTWLKTGGLEESTEEGIIGGSDKSRHNKQRSMRHCVHVNRHRETSRKGLSCVSSVFFVLVVKKH